MKRPFEAPTIDSPGGLVKTGKRAACSRVAIMSRVGPCNFTLNFLKQFNIN